KTTSPSISPRPPNAEPVNTVPSSSASFAMSICECETRLRRPHASAVFFSDPSVRGCISSRREHCWVWDVSACAQRDDSAENLGSAHCVKKVDQVEDNETVRCEWAHFGKARTSHLSRRRSVPEEDR